MMSDKRRVLIAAIKSGSGKTIFTCGLLKLLKDRLKRQPAGLTAYKCGPDYIDPMFHKTVLEIDGTNLDPFFSDGEDLCRILAEDQAEFSIIEGAMGIYDGITGMGKTGSCYEVAQKTGTPILLVTDASGMGRTLVSVVKGILADDEDHLVRGIVFNRMSEAYLDTLRPELERMFQELGRSIRILGAIPKLKELQFESRHLGLLMPEEIRDAAEQIRAYAEILQAHLDVDGLLEMAGQAVIQVGEAGSSLPAAGKSPCAKVPSAVETALKETGQTPWLTLGIARDEAFCFYYTQNLKLLETLGVKLRPFSPLHEAHLPDGLDGLLLGGGYPELYLPELSANESMRKDIRKAIAAGMPSLAECGGFMYLHQFIEENGVRYPMAGVLAGGVRNKGKLTRFGYVTVTPADRDDPDTASPASAQNDPAEREYGLLQAPVKGHEFHYYDSDDNGASCIAEKPGTGRFWPCMHMGTRHLWGYPHLYYPSCPDLAERFVRQMKQYQNTQNEKH